MTAREPDDSLADYVNTKILYQAGVDFESRPIVVCNACNLPDPVAFDYGNMLDLILLKLDLFVENDYTVILFSGGAKFRPSWSWLLRAYRSLSRKYKKNLKALWIVHPTLWARVFLNVMNAVLSPKFSRKIVYCRTLSQLAVHVPLVQIDIPKEAYEYNVQFESEIKFPLLPNQVTPSMFGIPLSTVMGIDGEKGLPKVVMECIQYLRAKGLKTKGLFRRSPSSAELKEAKTLFDEGHEVDLEQYGVHVAAVLLKMYFRELPQPIFSQDNYPSLLQFQKKIISGDEAAAITDLRELVLSAVPMPEQILLKEVMLFLREVVAENAVNLMTSFNIAVVWAPNLARSGNPILDVSVTSTAVASAIRLCLDHHTEVFEGVQHEGWHPQPSPAIPIRAVGNSLSVSSKSSLSPSQNANVLAGSVAKNVALVEKSPAVAIGMQAPTDTDLLDDLRKAIPGNSAVP